MDIKHQSLVLDINETRNYTFIKACQGDQKSRYIDCTLTQNGSVLSLTSNYRAIVKASINNEVKAINSCTIDTTSQVIVVELTSIMLDTPGILNCEITVQDGQQIVTSQAFAVQVRQSTIANETEIKKSKEYGALVDALSSIADVESKADRVQTLVDNIDKLKSANDIINRLSTSETNIAANKASIKELSELVQEVKNSAIAEIESLKAGKLDKADFNSYKTSNDNAVNSKVDTTDFNTYKTATDKAVADNTKSIKANTTAIDKCVSNIASNSALINQNAIKATTDKSTSIVLNDSSDCNIVNLICDEKDDSKQIAFYRKNLFDFNNIRTNANDSASNAVVNKNSKSISFTTSETGANSGIYIRHTNYQDYKGYGVDYTKLNGKSVTLSLDIQSDINCRIGVQFIKYSYSYFDITSEKQRIVVTDTVDINKLNKALCFYTNKTKANITISNIQIEVNNTATDYEDCDCQKVTLTDADVNSLHTYYPSTTVISDSDFVLTYVADTKNYIDNKFNELATAIVAHESEVM